jgi:hypothetical protein
VEAFPSQWKLLQCGNYFGGGSSKHELPATTVCKRIPKNIINLNSYLVVIFILSYFFSAIALCWALLLPMIESTQPSSQDLSVVSHLE